ncbi:hypothetical protein GGS21DRAFT_455281 [Xylaria nigripes]|nr:hypothetical protein GGS21DRAFT_455281 [Xylaria nigripes]
MCCLIMRDHRGRRKPNQAQKVNASDPKATPRSHKFKKYFAKHRRQTRDSTDVQESLSGQGSAELLPGSRPPSNQEASAAIQPLWGHAYDALREDDRRLVNEYEELLSKEAPITNDRQNEGIEESSARAMPSRQAQLNTICSKGLQRLDEKKTKFTIAGHEFNLSDQIAGAANLALWAKDLIGEATKQSPEASIVWAGVCIILPLLTKPVVADEACRNGFTYVTARMRYYSELEPTLEQLGTDLKVRPALMMEAKNQIVDLYKHIIQFQIQSVLRFYKQSFGRYLSDIFEAENWKTKKLEIEKLENIVNENLSQINQYRSIHQLKSLSNKSEKSLQMFQQLLSVSEEQLSVAREQLSSVKRGVEIQEEEAKQRLSDRQAQCLRLFRLTSNSKDVTYEWYKDRVEDRVAGTCEWLLKHENFTGWLNQASGPLLVSADPGCGKSVLAKYLVDHGLPRSSTICYFFFKDQDQNTVRQALCALLHQLFLQKPSLLEHATTQYDRDGAGLINSTTSLWTVLLNAAKDARAGSVIVVLDALDECDESEFKDLIWYLESQFRSNESTPGRLKYLLTCRPYEQITSKFQHLSETFPYIRIPGEEESETISQEVNHVIKKRLEDLAKEKGLTDQVKDHLAEKLLSIPHRTYLWVYLVFDYLTAESFKKTLKGVDSTMESLPKNVNQAYGQILSKSREKDKVRKALSIILAAYRPLTVSEMNVAWNIDETSQSIHDLDLEEENDFISRLRSCCGLFVSVHHSKIYFLHQTAREFLLASQSHGTIPSELRWQHSITEVDAHKVLAELCVRYLDFLNEDDIPTDGSQEAELRLKSYTFFDYSVRNWGDHFRQACIGVEAGIMPATLRIYDPHSRSYTIWFQEYGKPSYKARNLLAGLSMSSWFGHESIVKLQFEKGVDIECKDKDGCTPLMQAAYNGHEQVVKLLLEKGADIESKDNICWTPLMQATYNGHEQVVKLLLEKGADIKSKDKYGQTPLMLAKDSGKEEIVDILVEWSRSRV